MAGCNKHREVTSAGVCRSCASEFCDDCLVYSYGRHKAPYCIRCALIAAGATPVSAAATSLSA